MSTVGTHATITLPSAIVRFALHFLEMCVVMCMGGALVDFVFFSAAGALGYPELASTATAVSIGVIGLNAAAVMAAYMYVRGHSSRHNLEMSGGTLVTAVALVAASLLGWISAAESATWPVLFGFVCTPLCAVMLLVMAIRFDHYGGRAKHV